MIPSAYVDAIAQRVLTLFLLSQGWEPSAECDVRDYDCHRTWTVSACVPPDTEIEALKMHFNEYLGYHNACLTAVKFGFYGCTVYPCSHCRGKHLYLSIYQ